MKKSNFWKGKKVLVTGGNGFIGSFLTERFLSNKALVSITEFSKDKSNLSQVIPGAKIIRGDLLNYKFAEKASKGTDVIFHLAALKKNSIFRKKYPVETFETNIKLAENILKAAKNNKVRKVVLVSTSLVSAVEKNAASESYVWAKKVTELFAEFYASQYGMDITVVRLNNTFGPRDNFDEATAQVIPSLIRKIKNKQNPLIVFGTGDEKRQFLYVENVISALLKAGEAGNKKFNIIELNAQKSVSIKEIIKIIMEIESVKIPVKFLGGKKKDKNLEIKKNVAILVKLKPALKKTLDWYAKSAKR